MTPSNLRQKLRHVRKLSSAIMDLKTKHALIVDRKNRLKTIVID
jgi:hypothetical protein